MIVGIAMKICGFRIFRTFKNHLTIGFSRKYLLTRIGTAVISNAAPLTQRKVDTFDLYCSEFRKLTGFRLHASQPASH